MNLEDAQVEAEITGPKFAEIEVYGDAEEEQRTTSLTGSMDNTSTTAGGSNLKLYWANIPEGLNPLLAPHSIQNVMSAPVAEANLETVPRRSIQEPQPEKTALYLSPNSSSSSISDIQSGMAPSTTPSSVDDVAQKQDLFTEILLKDPELKSLLLDTHRALDPENFITKLERLLKRMSLSLNQESTEKIQRDTSKFVNKRAGGLAAIVQSKIDTQSPIKRKKLTKFLHGQSQGAPDINYWLHSTTPDEPLEDNQESMPDSGTSYLEDEIDLPPLHLRPLENFIINSQALNDFREGLIHILLPIQMRSWKGNEMPKLVEKNLQALEHVGYLLGQPIRLNEAIDPIVAVCGPLAILCEYNQNFY